MVSQTNFNNKISFLSLIVVFSLTFFISYNSFAQKNTADDLQKKFDVAFNKMLDDPSNIDLTMKYANLAIQMKDYESAIPALERILLFNPELPRVKQELGVLYYKLDSFEMARSYLKDAISSKNVPSDVVDKASSYLQKIK
jgi:tetratricopeptide (TPR) repeat protein